MNFKSLESHQKLNGCYYTPNWLADFIMRWVLSSSPKTILEPSCGDGVFFDVLPRAYNGISICGFDIDEKATTACENKLKNIPVQSKIITRDFLQWAIENLTSENTKTFEAVAGNPPFIRYQYWDKEMQDRAQVFFELMGMKFSKHINAWVPFLIAAIKFLSAGGHLGMVLPAELLHVLYAKGLREYILQECSQILITDPEDIWFEDTLQGAIILMARKKTVASQNTNGIAIIRTSGKSFAEENPSDLFAYADYVDGDFLKNKWTYALLTHEERQAYVSLCANPNVYSFSELATTDVGIVTGANKFFLVPDNVVDEYSLQDVAHPMFGRSEHCPGIIYDQEQHMGNVRNGISTNFLYFDGVEDEVAYKEYLNIGVEQKLTSRYKCRVRTPWYRVPSVYASPISMLKRSNGMPRLILNALNAYTTDTAYRILPAKPIDNASLVVCFLNSLTALSAELEGRHYGGGVLELVPSEIDRLKVPYANISTIDIMELNSFVKQNSENEVVNRQDETVFSQFGADMEQVKTLQYALSRIKNRRQRIATSEV